MKFLLDHDVPGAIGKALERQSHEAATLRSVLPQATPDGEIWQYVREQGLLIITCNRNHFLILARESIRRGEEFPGLILLFRRHSRAAECAKVLALLAQAGEAGLRGNVNFA